MLSRDESKEIRLELSDNAGVEPNSWPFWLMDALRELWFDDTEALCRLLRDPCGLPMRSEGL